MSRKSSAERQQEIVQAVLSLIAEQGIQGVTMTRIADRVGITEAALYRHFRGKMEIVAATIDTTFDELYAILTVSADGGTTCEMLKNVLTAHLRFIEKHPGMARILFSDEVHFNSPSLRKKLSQRGEQVSGLIAKAPLFSIAGSSKRRSWSGLTPRRKVNWPTARMGYGRSMRSAYGRRSFFCVLMLVINDKRIRRVP